MVNVCARYCGTTILLDSFETEEEAENFMQHNYILYYADETENNQDEIIYPNEMFIESEVPFYEPAQIINEYDIDELPF